MKILQNPIAVIILALVAVALIAKQIAWPMIQRSHWMQSASAIPSPVTPAMEPASQPQPGNSNLASNAAAQAATEPKIDAAAGSNAAHLAESSPRDPFQGQKIAKVHPPASEVLTFNSFWRQSGGALAVINNQVVAVGDSILGYKVKAIDHDRVEVEGPNGREDVEFGTRPARLVPPPQAGPPSGAQTNSVPSANPDK